MAYTRPCREFRSIFMMSAVACACLIANSAWRSTSFLARIRRSAQSQPSLSCQAYCVAVVIACGLEDSHHETHGANFKTQSACVPQELHTYCTSGIVSDSEIPCQFVKNETACLLAWQHTCGPPTCIVGSQGWKEGG